MTVEELEGDFFRIHFIGWNSRHDEKWDKAKLQRYMLNGFTVATGARATGRRQPNTHPQMPPYACFPVHAQCVSEGRGVTVELVG